MRGEIAGWQMELPPVRGSSDTARQMLRAEPQLPYPLSSANLPLGRTHLAPEHHTPFTKLTHLHLVCGKCGDVGDAPITTAAPFVQSLLDDYGFKTDVTHFAIYGICAKCADPR